MVKFQIDDKVILKEEYKESNDYKVNKFLRKVADNIFGKVATIVGVNRSIMSGDLFCNISTDDEFAISVSPEYLELVETGDNPNTEKTALTETESPDSDEVKVVSSPVRYVTKCDYCLSTISFKLKHIVKGNRLDPFLNGSVHCPVCDKNVQVADTNSKIMFPHVEGRMY